MTVQEQNEKWFFEGGYEGMNKLQQVDYLVTECGWSEDCAFDTVYMAECNECDDGYDYVPDDYYGEEE
jgi:hypothetical protein